MPSVAFVINPSLLRDPAGFGRRCLAVAARRGWKAWLAETSEREDGSGLARDAVAAGAELVFAAGGDGTVRACAQALADTGIPLAIVPLGTANLTARALGVPARTRRAIEVGFEGQDRRIDLAAVDPGIVCVAMAGIGLDAAVVAGAGRRGKRRLGWVVYAVSGMARLALPPQEFTVRVDGGAALVRRARCVVVGNAGLLPGGFTLLPLARLDDGLLDVGILAPGGLAGWVRVAGRVLIHGRHTGHEAGSGRGRGAEGGREVGSGRGRGAEGWREVGSGRGPRIEGGREVGRGGRELEWVRGRRVEIYAVGGALPRQIDGEVTAPGRTLNVYVRPGALTVRVPR